MDEMNAQLLDALRSLMTGAGETDLAPTRLKPFLAHCARRPLALDGRPVLLPLKALLLNHAYLRPEVKAALDKTLHEQWRRFTAASPSPSVVAREPQPPAPVPEPALPDDDRPVSRTVKEDWFDRFLNGVRCLFFL
jgi:hypothetical protein